MARPRKTTGGKTSFGKQSDAEKSFYNRKKTRPERGSGDDRPRNKFARRDGDSESRPSRPSRFGSKPGFSKRRSDEGGESGGPFKRTGGFKKSFSGGGPFKRSGGFSRGDGKRPFAKRSADDQREGGTPFRKSGGFKKSFSSGEGSKPFGRRSSEDQREGGAPFKRSGGFSRGEGKKPFGKRSGEDQREGDAPFRKSGGFKKSYSREGGEEKKPFRKKFSDEKSEGRSGYANKGFTKRGAGDERPFKKREGDSFKPREEGSSGFSKRPVERKSFVESRIEKSRQTRAPREEKPKSDSDLIRLNKFLANSGVGSRREADELIKMGLVTVNGETVTEMGHKVKATDDVRYEGKKMKAEKPVYILLNKPKGYITTTDDPQERNTVMGLVAGACKERIYPVGRLDRNTTGLLLLTNDGDLADKLTHPSYKAKKIYKVELDKPLSRADFEKIQQGVRLEEGRAMVDDLAIVSDDKKTIGIELHIGWNRIVRRIFESLDYQVVKLDRVVYAGLDKKDLARGQWRFLKPEEVVSLKHFN